MTAFYNCTYAACTSLYIKSPINFLQRTLWLRNCRLRIFTAAATLLHKQAPRTKANMDQSLVAAWTSAHSHIYVHVECKNHSKKIVRAVKAGRASERESALVLID
jgi:hypothetical protein